jgi:hypothetical protein
MYNFVVKTQKREKGCEAKMWCQLLIILRLLINTDMLLIVVIRNVSRVNAKSSQLGRSQ